MFQLLLLAHSLIVEAFDLAGNFKRLKINFFVVPDPDARDDFLSIKRGVWGSIDTLANDVVPPMATLEYTVLTQPQSGSLIQTQTNKMVLHHIF